MNYNRHCWRDESIVKQNTKRYVWKKNGSLISGNSSSISVTESALYSVKSISVAGCESIEKFISVMDSGKATITFNDIELIDDSDNNKKVEFVLRKVDLRTEGRKVRSE